MCTHNRKFLVWRIWSVTLHPACPLKVTQIFQGNNHLLEVHPSLLWFTAPPGQVNEGKILQCLCFSQDLLVKTQLSALCACSVSRLISSRPVPSYSIPSHPIPSHPHSILLHCNTSGKGIELFCPTPNYVLRGSREQLALLAKEKPSKSLGRGGQGACHLSSEYDGHSSQFYTPLWVTF